MKITIIGAGALGGYFGARLDQAGHHVQFYVRPRRAKQLEECGLTVYSPHGNYTIDLPHVVQHVKEIQKVDLVLLTVKGYHLTDVMPQLKWLVNKGAKVLPLLNGIEHIYTLQEELGKENVLGGLAFIIATLDDRGHVVHSSQEHNLYFGALHPSQEPLCTALSKVWKDSNMDALYRDNIRYDMWEKYMFITAFSGITTVGDFPIETVKKVPATLMATKRVLEEMKMLANAYNIPITEETVQANMSKMLSFSDDATSSMHQDKRKGLMLEVDHLQGGALRLADSVRMEMPHIYMMYGILKAYENNKKITTT
ncbi:ketopantoate reductase family protein [Pontibacillus litoralis]|uniref:2-dehydropantoate 2-reductase n=1 Tax=Pontibacillus litoralis JSM 072002 TaxID=1385512 RepID=A0A0A5G234_9BACI|nr:ketopantoate reductase family protein [Pontibacillus litoralis]KGX85135.1 hypothetical protein N784_10130 [Pontibacillus litoralis JSM 072002]